MNKLIIFLLVAMFSMIAMSADVPEKVQMNDTVFGYSAPSIDSVTKIFVPANEIFEVLDISGNWIKVKAISGTDNVGAVGWVFKKGMADESTVGGEGVAVRVGPGSKNERLCSFRAGTVVKIVERQIQWYKVKYRNDVLWIYHTRAKII